MLILLSVVLALFLVAWLLTIRMPGPAFSGELPPLTSDQEALSERLRQHVLRLAGEIGERNHAVYWLVTHPVNKFWLKDDTLTSLGGEFFALDPMKKGAAAEAGSEGWITLRDKWCTRMSFKRCSQQLP